MDINLIDILGTLGTILSGVGIGWLSKSGRMKEKADAYKKMGEAYQYRIDTLHQDIDTCNKTIKELQERIAELNHALNVKEDELRAMKEASDKEIQDKKLQIRNLTDKMYQSEQEVNRVQDLLNDAKDEIIRRTEERDQERADKEYYKQWKCIKSQCNDPEGRRPPNSKLADQVFVDPEKRRHGKAASKINIDK